MVEQCSPVSTLWESGLKGVGAGTLDHADECPGIENDLQYWSVYSIFRSGDTRK